MKRPIVYVAGPYSGGNVSRNVQKALQQGDIIYDMGALSFVPHLCHLWDLVTPQPYHYWLNMDMEWLEQVQACFRMEGESPGADKEVARCEELGIPVFTDIFKLQDWIDKYLDKQEAGEYVA
jgi:hypothetical protein